MTPADPIARAISAMQARPRLALALLAIADMTLNRRSCRVSIDVRDGIMRIFRENQEHAIPLDAAPDLPPPG